LVIRLVLTPKERKEEDKLERTTEKKNTYYEDQKEHLIPEK
jgi:hypothetical protein